MKQITKGLLIYISLLLMNSSFSQSELKFANIGDYTTTEGKVIKDCKIGYRTVGQLNADKSNAVLWPTWFTGTSEHVFSFGAIDNMLDTEGLYVIVVDALTNGVSSSPSNTLEFPKISIRDMVNSQHTMLVNHLKIEHLQAVIGISMGGMQAYEWAVAYPDFMDKVIPIIGTPKQSSQDLLIWQTMAEIITHAKQEGEDLDQALKLASNIEFINLYTPAYVAKNYPADSVEVYKNTFRIKMKPLDILGGLNAMISHDIYKSVGISPVEIKNTIKADMLIIIATHDHLVNPISSIDFSEIINAKLIRLESNCGHMSPFCEADKVKMALSSFLK